MPLSINTYETAMSNNLTKRDIVIKIFTEKGYPQKHIRDRNFGVFQVQVRKSRVGRNPNRPETDVIIPKRAVIKFKAGKELKAKLKSYDVEKPSQDKPQA
ncbi:MAG: hypothetical protein RL304_635 [Verrucomicrobiota bacterium]